MNFSNSLELTQSQKLIITTQLKQSLNILHMSKLELENEINKEMQENPLLEVDKITYTTTNYNDLTGSSFKVEYTFEKNVLYTVVDSYNNDFARQMSIILVKEIAKLQGVTSTDIDKYVLEKADTNKIDNGFEFTVNEDGSAVYKIATDIKVDINK